MNCVSAGMSVYLYASILCWMIQKISNSIHYYFGDVISYLLEGVSATRHNILVSQSRPVI
jgi:hypothetical protein